MVTFFSFVMSVIFSSLLMLSVHLLRKNKRFIQSFGVPAVLAAYLVCIGRMLLPFEFGFTKVVELPTLYNAFFEEVYMNTYSIGTASLNLFNVFTTIWFVGALAGASYLLMSYMYIRKRIRSLSQADEEAELTLKKIEQEKHCKLNIRVRKSKYISIPTGMGAISKIIVLPDENYSPQEHDYILNHELSHFINHDFIIKLLTRIFCTVFWWNPLVYVFANDVDQMLEIKCDLSVTVNLSSEDKSAYLRVIVNSLKKSSEINSRLMSRISTQLHEKSKLSMVERFELIKVNKRPNTRKYQVAFIACILCLFCASYSVVFQSAYEAPPTETIGSEVDISEGYIVHHKDDTYTFVLPDGTSISMQEKTVDIFREEYPIKEE